LGELLAGLRQRPGDVGPVVPDGGGAALHLAGMEKRRERAWNVVEDALAALLLRLDRLPALSNTLSRARIGVAEDVRMTADEFLVDVSGHRLEVAVALLLEQQGEEVHLEQQVAELVKQLGARPVEGGVGHLIGLLDRVRDDRARRLLAVPGAIASQPP